MRFAAPSDFAALTGDARFLSTPHPSSTASGDNRVRTRCKPLFDASGQGNGVSVTTTRLSTFCSGPRGRLIARDRAVLECFRLLRLGAGIAGKCGKNGRRRLATRSKPRPAWPGRTRVQPGGSVTHDRDFSRVHLLRIIARGPYRNFAATPATRTRRHAAAPRRRQEIPRMARVLQNGRLEAMDAAAMGPRDLAEYFK